MNSIYLTNQSKELKPGDELAYFSFGSTVILLIENENLQFATSVTVGKEIKYGERLLSRM